MLIKPDSAFTEYLNLDNSSSIVLHELFYLSMHLRKLGVSPSFVVRLSSVKLYLCLPWAPSSNILHFLSCFTILSLCSPAHWQALDRNDGSFFVLPHFLCLTLIVLIHPSLSFS